jgi:hypothetical protein
MRIVAVTMLRNEADILPDLLGHWAALFDEVLLVDHASTDGTSEMLEAATARTNLRSWRFAQDAKMQAVVVTALAREAAARGADWIVPLDADEFPLLPTRAAFEAALADGPPVRRWSWRNVWPASRPGFHHFAAAGTHDSVRSSVRKILFRGEIARNGGPRFGIGTGSHAVTPTPAPPEPMGELVHIPLRHIDRVALKIAINVANEATRPGRQAHENHQYARGEAWLERFRGPEGEAAMRRFALFYPHIPQPRDVAGVEPLAFVPLGRLEGLPEPRGFDEVMAREAALAWDPLPEGHHARWRLRLDGREARLVAEPE